jgi:hypothetical protein
MPGTHKWVKCESKSFEDVPHLLMQSMLAFKNVLEAKVSQLCLTEMSERNLSQLLEVN